MTSTKDHLLSRKPSPPLTSNPLVRADRLQSSLLLMSSRTRRLSERLLSTLLLLNPTLQLPNRQPKQSKVVPLPMGSPISSVGFTSRADTNDGIAKYIFDYINTDKDAQQSDRIQCCSPSDRYHQTNKSSMHIACWCFYS